MKNKIKDNVFYKAFFVMTLTMAMQNLIVFGVNLADSVMMGAYSETALSGVGICNNIQFFLNMAASGVASGMMVIAAQYWGKKEKKPIYKVSAVAMWISFIFSMLIFGFAALAPETLIRLFTDKEAVIEQAVLYLDVIKYSYLLFAFTTIMFLHIAFILCSKHYT